MKKSYAMLGAALIAGAGCAAIPSAPDMATAAGEQAKASGACLRNDLLWGFNVVNERTLRLTDRYYNEFTVRMTSGCVGLNNLASNLRLRTKTRLGCLERGDRVTFREPTLGQMSCSIIAVESNTPEPKTSF